MKILKLMVFNRDSERLFLRLKKLEELPQKWFSKGNCNPR